MIKVKVCQDFMGSICLSPVSKKHARRIAESNAYDGVSDVYIQTEWDIDSFLKDLNYRQRQDILQGRAVIILMDDWTYRHMVGGQSD